MAKQTMTAPQRKPMTEGQTDTLTNKFRDAVRKKRGKISAESAQWFLGLENPGMMLVGMMKELVEEAAKKTFVVHVFINRTRTKQRALDATGYQQHVYCGRDVDNAPVSGSEKEDIVLFLPLPCEYPSGVLGDKEAEGAYKRRGLQPADLVAVAAMNEKKPTLVDKMPHVTIWKDDEGKWCYAVFYLKDGKRRVCIDRDVHAVDHSGNYLAGVKKRQ